MSEQMVAAMADQLRQYATHFAQSDWNYTRRHDLKHIRHRGDWSGYDSIPRRIKRWLDDYVPFRKRDSWAKEMGGNIARRHPIIHARASLRTPDHLPDGVLDGGGIIVHWEESGEYLQYVQPSVGALLADLMEAHASLPEVQAVAAEMKRINDAYGARVEAGDVE